MDKQFLGTSLSQNRSRQVDDNWLSELDINLTVVNYFLLIKKMNYRVYQADYLRR